MDFVTIKAIKLYLRSFKNKLIQISIFVIIGCILIYYGNFIGIDNTSGSFLLSLGSAILAIGLITQVSEFITSMKILSVMRLYGDYTEHGIKRIFASKDDQEYKYLKNKKFQEARKINILTLIGRGFIETESKLNETKQKIIDSVEFKLLVLKPYCNHWDIRYQDFEPEDLDVIGTKKVDEIQKLFENLKSDISKLNKIGKELRYYDRMPIFQLEIYDDTMFIAFYGLNSRAKYSPILMFEKKSGSSVFKYFEDQFRNYWEREDDE